jgi:hypothetical protein
VEPNAHKIEEHQRKYQRLRKERESRKAARTKARQQAEAKVVIPGYLNSLCRSTFESLKLESQLMHVVFHGGW